MIHNGEAEWFAVRMSIAMADDLGLCTISSIDLPQKERLTLLLELALWKGDWFKTTTNE